MGVKRKYYVVWSGKKPGIYDNWESCKSQIFQVAGAKYKAFETRDAAERAFNSGVDAFYAEMKKKNNGFLQFDTNFDVENRKPILQSLSVDAAWNSVTKVMEYRGVYTETGKVLFHKGPFPRATNNVGEFLAIVHGLAFLKKQNSGIPLYSDSITAISWVRRKKHNSVILPTEENAEVIDLLSRAERWLHENTYSTRIIKWETKLWGEIPADFGRK